MISSPIKVYILVDPPHVDEIFIDELMHNLKESIKKMGEEETTERAIMKSHDKEMFANVLW